MTLIKGRYKGADGDQQVPVQVDQNGQIRVEVNDVEITAIVTDLDTIVGFLDQRCVSIPIAKETNKAAGTYNYYVDMTGYNNIGFQWILSFTAGSTIKVYGTLQDDGTPDTGCTYRDLTSAIWGVVSITASGTSFDYTGVLGLCKYVKVEVIIGAGGGGIDDYTIYAKKSW